MKCPNCKGRGELDDPFANVTCLQCNGTGEMKITPYHVYTKYNLNDYCQVKMTAHGLEILRTEGDVYFNHNYDARINILETSLWVIMEIFGKHMNNGGHNVFLDNIINIKDHN